MQLFDMKCNKMYTIKSFNSNYLQNKMEKYGIAIGTLCQLIATDKESFVVLFDSTSYLINKKLAMGIQILERVEQMYAK